MKNSKKSNLMGDFSAYAMNQEQQQTVRGQKIYTWEYVEEKVDDNGDKIYYLYTIMYDTNTHLREVCVQLADIASF